MKAQDIRLDLTQTSPCIPLLKMLRPPSAACVVIACNPAGAAASLCAGIRLYTCAISRTKRVLFAGCALGYLLLRSGLSSADTAVRPVRCLTCCHEGLHLRCCFLLCMCHRL